MIPSTTAFLEEDFEIEEQPTLTYAMDVNSGRVRGYTDELAAMQQAIYKILNTERYQYAMYSWNYGIELSDLFGEPVSYVCPELERRITEALTWDSRVTDVTDFEFETSAEGKIHAAFTVSTIFGSISSETEVEI